MSWLNVAFAILFVGTSGSAESATFVARCRKAIHGSFHVDKFDDWSIITNDMTSELDGVSISPGPPSGLPAAAPDDYQKKGIKSGFLKLESKENWLVCHHSNFKMVIEHKIPAGLKSCTVADAGDSLSVSCR
jgi:hypothetical protein